MKDIDRLEELIKQFEILQSVMINENENNWIKSINDIVFCLKSNNLSSKEKLQYAKDSYINLIEIKGGFSDFFIWRDREEDRINANFSLERNKENIWHLIKLYE